MKYELLIISIFLITSIVGLTSIDQTNMTVGIEKTFTKLTSLQKKYFTIYTYSSKYSYKYTFKLKVNNTYNCSSSSFYLSYIKHSSNTPSTSSSEYYITLTNSSNTTRGYYTYEASYIVPLYNYYLSFVLSPKINIDSVSITITRTNSENTSNSNNKVSEIIFIIIFFSIFFFCLILCVVIFICRACCECFRPKPIILEPVPQPNYAPLTPQYQPQPQYPPQYAQQNINGYAPGQFYTN